MACNDTAVICSVPEGDTGQSGLSDKALSSQTTAALNYRVRRNGDRDRGDRRVPWLLHIPGAITRANEDPGLAPVGEASLSD